MTNDYSQLALLRATVHILRCANHRMTGRMTVRHLLSVALVCAVLGLAALVAQTPTAPAQQQPAPTADPYANNANPGATQFPLAAPAGKDSNALMVAPPGATNQGAF